MLSRFRRARVAPTLSPPPGALLRQDGELPEAAARVVLWVHWQADGLVSPPDLLLLRGFQEMGYVVVAVGNRDDEASERFVEALEGVATVVLQRQNIGYDFAGYRDGLLWLRHRLDPSAQIVLLNNSMYGPWGDLSHLLAAADPGLADVWAITESIEIQRHLQSYLLVIHPPALRNEGFWRHWSSVRPPVEKMDVVAKCELPLAASLRACGLRTAAVLPYDDFSQLALETPVAGAASSDGTYARVFARLRLGESLNPTHHLWRWMVVAGVPLVKKDLLRVNPPMLPDVDSWEAVVGDSNVELATLVREDIERARAELKGRADP